LQTKANKQATKGRTPELQQKQTNRQRREREQNCKQMLTENATLQTAMSCATNIQNDSQRLTVNMGHLVSGMGRSFGFNIAAESQNGAGT